MLNIVVYKLDQGLVSCACFKDDYFITQAITSNFLEWCYEQAHDLKDFDLRFHLFDVED